MLIAVIIPFYQVEAGILTAALEGVWAQQLPPGVRLQVFVVDDSSPHPAKVELAGMIAPAPHTLTVIRQENTGPGGARNTALDALTDAVDLIALLDSDDVWGPEHLMEAIRALETGADFYFCDHRRPSWHEQSAFEIDPILQRWIKEPDSGPVERLPDRPGLYGLKPGRAVEGFVDDYMAQTSTVVFRRPPLINLRFDTNLRTAGEDHLFWIEAAATAGRVVFSTASNVTCGSGVNLYFGSFGWKRPEATRRFAGLTLFYTILDQRLKLSEAQRRIVRRRRRNYGQAFVYLWLTVATKTRQLDWAIWRTLLRATPMMAPRLAVAAVAVSIARLVDPGGFYEDWK